ncbi:hypothetical protein ACFO3D_12300 [Virgibacillus kekensis]|uniref:Uncharacterized protein n=1 Tax=Virgibacillus kekensis TaxID=202261 RepID=A0ABV9DJG6_9BACI
MNSKLIVLLVVILTLLILAFAWFYLKDIMLDYDVDSDTSQPASIDEYPSQLI